MNIFGKQGISIIGRLPWRDRLYGAGCLFVLLILIFAVSALARADELTAARIQMLCPDAQRVRIESDGSVGYFVRPDKLARVRQCVKMAIRETNPVNMGGRGSHSIGH